MSGEVGGNDTDMGPWHHTPSTNCTNQSTGLASLSDVAADTPGNSLAATEPQQLLNAKTAVRVAFMKYVKLLSDSNTKQQTLNSAKREVVAATNVVRLISAAAPAAVAAPVTTAAPAAVAAHVETSKEIISIIGNIVVVSPEKIRLNASDITALNKITVFAVARIGTMIHMICSLAARIIIYTAEAKRIAACRAAVARLPPPTNEETLKFAFAQRLALLLLAVKCFDGHVENYKMHEFFFCAC